MPGLVPGIHVLKAALRHSKGEDGLAEPGRRQRAAVPAPPVTGFIRRQAGTGDGSR
jgi:hypothetical protein